MIFMDIFLTRLEFFIISKNLKSIFLISLHFQCDSSCMQRRHVYCMQDMEYVDYTLCKLQTRPNEEQDCSSENCVREPHYRWESLKCTANIFFCRILKTNEICGNKLGTWNEKAFHPVINYFLEARLTTVTVTNLDDRLTK